MASATSVAGAARRTDEPRRLARTTRHAFGLLLTPPDGSRPALLLFNAEPAPALFVLPRGAWQRVVDSAGADTSPTPIAEAAVDVQACGVVVLIGEELPR